ncbi:MAG: hypothetical protein BWY64_03810 [bacterium ADurb.Bin363]|nr:MAG: hypothetical protein BWY64_03810 [bacterium ADurb.Bin363]
MSHHWYTGGHNSFNTVRYFSTTLQFYGITGSFCHKSACITNSTFDRWLIGHIWHISNKPYILCSSPDSLGMANHILHCHRKCTVIAEHCHPKTISHQNHINSRFILEICSGIIITGKHCNGLSLPLLSEKIGKHDFFTFRHFSCLLSIGNR